MFSVKTKSLEKVVLNNPEQVLYLNFFPILPRGPALLGTQFRNFVLVS